MTEPFDLMAFAEEGEREGGGYICQFKISGGYLVFASGPRAGRFFEVKDEASADEAKAAAKELGLKHETRYQRVVALEMYADSVVNKDQKPTWQGGVWAHDFVVWQDAYREILKPSLVTAMADGLVNGEKTWGNISFKADPRKPEREDGNPNLRPFIVRIFANEEEAREYALSPDSEENGAPAAPDIPEEWATEFPDNAQEKWNETWRDMINHFTDNPDDTNFDAWVWEEAGLTEDVIGLAKAKATEASADSDIPF